MGAKTIEGILVSLVSSLNCVPTAHRSTTITAMTLCKRCLSLDIDAILKGPATRILVPDVVYDADIYTYRYQAVDPDEPEPPHEFQLYHDSPESLHESSKTCDLCRIIWPQADAALDEGMTYAAKRWYSTEPRDQRLWACGISGMQGLIVLSREPHRDEDDYRMYQLVAAVGFCVGEGKAPGSSCFISQGLYAYISDC